MADFSFKIQNPDSNPVDDHVLYVGQPNQLNFVFSNSIGIPKVNLGDVFTIMIPENLIEPASANQLLSKDWKVNESGVTCEGGYYNYYLSPQKKLEFNSELTISLHNLIGQTATMGQVKCSAYVSSQNLGIYQTKLIVMQPPGQNSSLYDDINFGNAAINENRQTPPIPGKVYISPTVTVGGKVQLSPPIANQIHINLKFKKKHTQLVDKWDLAKKPRFVFSFSYGSNNNDLTNAIKSDAQEDDFNPLTSAWNIKARIGDSQSDRWQLTPQQGDTPVWWVEPTSSNLHLFTEDNPNLDIYFDHVITDLAEGQATLYILWANIPGYYGEYEAKDLPKENPDPMIESFTTKIPTYSSHQLPVLDWEVFGALNLQLSWNDKKCNIETKYDPSTPALIYPGSSENAVPISFLPPFKATLVHYDFTLMIPDQENSEKQINIALNAANPPVISDFNAAVSEKTAGTVLTLNWTVDTDIAIAYCEIDGVEGSFPLTGSHEIQLDQYESIPDEFTLQVKGFEPEVTAVITKSLKSIQNIPGFNIMDRQPLSNRLFLINKNNQVFYCDGIDIPASITDHVTIGGPPKANIKLFFSPDGKHAIGINTSLSIHTFGSAPSNTKVFYFDPANPPSVVTRTIASVNTPYFVFFTPDSSRAFIAGWGDDSRIAFFDPSNPPSKITPQIKAPASAAFEVKDLSFSLDSKIGFFSYPSNYRYNETYYFDPKNPPSLMMEAKSISTGSMISGYSFTPDNKTAYVEQLPSEETPYFPLDNIPARPDKSINCQQFENQTVLFSAKSKWGFMYYNSSQAVGYFDWANPPDKITNVVKLKNSRSINDMALNPTQDKIFITDASNNLLCYFNAIDPPEATTDLGTTASPGDIFFSLNGSRVYVNCEDNSVNVFEVCYV